MGQNTKKQRKSHKIAKKHQKSTEKSRYFVLHQWLSVKNRTMRTPAVQPRILSKKKIFHLHGRVPKQERNFGFLKIIFHLHINGGTQEKNF